MLSLRKVFHQKVLVLTDSMVVGLGKYMSSVLCNLLNRKSGEKQIINTSAGHLPLFAASISPVRLYEGKVSGHGHEWEISQIEFFQMNLTVRNKNYLDSFSGTCTGIVLLIWPWDWCMANFRLVWVWGNNTEGLG